MVRRGEVLALVQAGGQGSRMDVLARLLERADWLPAAACVLFVLPMAFTSGWERPRPQQELSPALVAALNANTEPGDVVLSDPETSYWIAAYGPVYVAVSAPTHVGDTKANRPYDRV